MTPLQLWLIILLLAGIAAAWRLSLKYALTAGLTTESVYTITALAWFLGAFLVFLVLNRKFVGRISADVSKVQQTWPAVLFLTGTALAFALAACVFYGLLQNNNVTTLFPVRSVLVLIMTVAGGLCLLKERIRIAQGAALALFVTGVVVMAADSVLSKRGTI